VCQKIHGNLDLETLTCMHACTHALRTHGFVEIYLFKYAYAVSNGYEADLHDKKRFLTTNIFLLGVVLRQVLFMVKSTRPWGAFALFTFVIGQENV
jgi:hypothetical protein